MKRYEAFLTLPSSLSSEYNIVFLDNRIFFE